MHTTIFCSILMAAHMIYFLEAIRCQSCFNYNGLACVSNPVCDGEYCLFEQILRPNGVISVKKTCLSSGQYQFDDGIVITNLNQCVARSTNFGQYHVLICSTGNECNSQCMMVPSPTPQPLPGTVSCYDCVSNDGSDCETSVCQGQFCVYEKRVAGNQISLKKGCLDTSVALLDDFLAVDVVGVCEIRNTLTSQYHVKICNDTNFCNNYCNPPVTIEPQRQPTIACYECDTYGADCFTGQCTAQYCLFERQRRFSTGTTYVKKSCTNLPFIEYPDNRLSTVLNKCETRTIDDIQYQVRVCNSGDNCNIACSTQEQQLMSCYQCETDQADCNTGSCQGKYCLFTRIQSSTNFHVKKACTNTVNLLYEDNVQYSSFGNCEYRQVNAVNYDFKLCNSSSYCNTACPLGPFSSLISSSHSALFQLMPLLLILLIFSRRI
uniref:DUF753 domain-containing protein n=1 Tax=Haemonchus contortus TaxID=6289 RepID=A0A7I4Y8Z6_HAECO